MQDAGAKRHRAERLLHPDRVVSHRRARSSSSTSTCCRAVKAAVTIPVAMKVGPYFSSFAQHGRPLDEAGADALVLFNRFYQPDFDIETRTVVPSLALSTPDEIRLPLLWIVAAPRPRAGLAGGDHRRAQLRRSHQVPDGRRRRRDEHVRRAAAGPGVLRPPLADMTAWMEKKGYASVGQMRGCMSQQSMPDTALSCGAITSRSSRATRRRRSTTAGGRS